MLFSADVFDRSRLGSTDLYQNDCVTLNVTDRRRFCIDLLPLPQTQRVCLGLVEDYLSPDCLHDRHWLHCSAVSGLLEERVGSRSHSLALQVNELEEIGFHGRLTI